MFGSHGTPCSHALVMVRHVQSYPRGCPAPLLQPNPCLAPPRFWGLDLGMQQGGLACALPLAKVWGQLDRLGLGLGAFPQAPPPPLQPCSQPYLVFFNPPPHMQSCI